MNTMDSTSTNTSNVFQSQQRQDLLTYFSDSMSRNNQSNDFMKFIMQSKEAQNVAGIFTNKANKNQDSTNRGGTFDSRDFCAFLQSNLSSPKDISSFLKSKESTDFSQPKSKESRAGNSWSKDPRDEKLKATNNHMTTNNTSAATIPKYKSQDWIKFNTLGKHIDVPISTGIFSSTSTTSSTKESPVTSVATTPSLRTDFSTSSMYARKNNPVESLEEGKTASTANSKKSKKKRKRTPRKKIVPEIKKYVEPTEKDVLMGRGGKSNHHPGNAKYRAQVDKFEGRYKDTDDKEEKARISKELVRTVKEYGGNFLEKDDTGCWYVIDDAVAHRKVSQALREDKDPEKRKAKRQRFLEKRAREQDKQR
eukprot:CAMPEP_0172398192 /NCGR_PEP_ID=MMETSP1061-20121228/34598_1 /TAXON_ID=37318 /ORGANISM="Pseudo-nitzschia pungens, Strain cf. pungens" /LENGTH=364 /DNA_ID=CAMNT_0013130595 /DNA_START=277 /DNA_END=1371 /DNA_ORIENTATION=+